MFSMCSPRTRIAQNPRHLTICRLHPLAYPAEPTTYICLAIAATSPRPNKGLADTAWRAGAQKSLTVRDCYQFGLI